MQLNNIKQMVVRLNQLRWWKSGSKMRIKKTHHYHANKEIAWYKYINGFLGKPFMADQCEG
jgi:hypothetical protein